MLTIREHGSGDGGSGGGGRASEHSVPSQEQNSPEPNYLTLKKLPNHHMALPEMGMHIFKKFQMCGFQLTSFHPLSNGTAEK